jgi:hypothetical protein
MKGNGGKIFSLRKGDVVFGSETRVKGFLRASVEEDFLSAP